MHEVMPFTSAEGLLRVLDNGGSWFNLLSTRDDGKVDFWEMHKAAPGWSDPRLFLTLAWWHLSHQERESIRKVIPPGYAKDLEGGRLAVWPSPKVQAELENQVPYIVEGELVPPRDSALLYTQLREKVGLSRTNQRERTVPLHERFDPWEIRTSVSSVDPGPLVFFKVKKKESLPGTRIRLAAVGSMLTNTVGGHYIPYLRPAFFTKIDADGQALHLDRDDGQAESKRALRAALSHKP